MLYLTKFWTKPILDVLPHKVVLNCRGDRGREEGSEEGSEEGARKGRRKEGREEGECMEG